MHNININLNKNNMLSLIEYLLDCPNKTYFYLNEKEKYSITFTNIFSLEEKNKIKLQIQKFILNKLQGRDKIEVYKNI